MNSIATVGERTVLVTGATGFIGGFLCSRLIKEGWRVRGAHLSSESPVTLPPGVEPVLVEPLGQNTPWSEALEGIGVVIHLAARVHCMDEPATDPLDAFRKVNVAGTVRLAEEASRIGVKRFVFVSSIKVNGEENTMPYTLDSPPAPVDPYGISKWEAEQELHRIGAETGMAVAVLRPVLVYGPGVKANFLNLLHLISRGIPIPLATVRNLRSLVYVENLVDVLAVSASHAAAVGKTFLVSDGENVSIPELIRRISRALGTPVRLISVPVTLMRVAGALTGKSEAIRRLTGSLTVDSSALRREFAWQPPYTMEEGLYKTAEWFQKVQR